MRISKYTNIFAKRHVPNWSEEFFVISKIKNTVPWTCVINDLNGEEIVGTFYGKELQKTNQEELIIEKVVKRKGNKLYAKSKRYDNSFSSWIYKKDIAWNESIFPKPYEPFGGDIKTKLIDLIMQQKQISKKLQELIQLTQQQNLIYLL